MPEILNRYYTDNRFSNLLVSQFENPSPLKVLDLGVGFGALLKPAISKWTNASFFATDIDNDSIKRLKTKNPNLTIKKIDGLSPSLPQKLKLSINSIDIAVCNPPYTKLKKSDKLEQIFDSIGFSNSLGMPYFTADAIFLAQNINFLKNHGELGIILSDTLLTSNDFLKFREDLLLNTSIKGIIQLPDNIFFQTEARTHILVLSKSKPNNLLVPLHISNSNGIIYKTMQVRKNELFNRMDFEYHHTISQLSATKTRQRLGNIATSIKRGKHSKKELLKILGNDKFIHLSNIKNPFLHIRKHILISSEACKGDILVARVGKRCIGRVSIVKSGKSEYSDCIYRIRVPEQFQQVVFNAFISKEGQKYLKAISHGVCTRSINKGDFENFPINI